MSLDITEKICIERDGKVIIGYDTSEVCKIEKVKINGKEAENLFMTMKQGGYYNLVKVFTDDSVKETEFKDCRVITDFQDDGLAGIMFYKDGLNGRYCVNYINTDLKLLFENKYIEILRVPNGMFIVAIDKVTQEGIDFKHKKLYGVIDKNGNEVIECKYSDVTYKQKTDTFDCAI